MHQSLPRISRSRVSTARTLRAHRTRTQLIGMVARGISDTSRVNGCGRSVSHIAMNAVPLRALIPITGFLRVDLLYSPSVVRSIHGRKKRKWMFAVEPAQFDKTGHVRAGQRIPDAVGHNRSNENQSEQRPHSAQGSISIRQQISLYSIEQMARENRLNNRLNVVMD